MEALQTILDAGIERGAAAGAVAVVVDRDGEVWSGAAGERSLGSGVAMTVDTVGAIFSMTKAITGAAAMHLVERGQLDLDAPAGEVLADLADPHVLTGFADDGTPITRPATSTVTLRNLLTHTSGYVYDIWNPDLGRWHEATGTPTVLSLQKVALRTPLAFDPGTQWEYGIGIDWAGQMVEAVSGQTLGQYFADHITGPMGMVDTSFAPGDDQLARFAGMHARAEDGSLTTIDLPAAENPEFEMGGGGLVGTMGDYGRFIRMILNDGELDGTQVLSPHTVQEMAGNHIGDLRVKKLITAAPPFSNDAELSPGEDKSWGLTFQRHEQTGSTGRAEGTLAWAGLANSYYWIDRENGIGGAYMTQMIPFADPDSVGLFTELETAVYAGC